MRVLILLVVQALLVCHTLGDNSSETIPKTEIKKRENDYTEHNNRSDNELKYIPFINLLDNRSDTSEFWLMTDILSLVKKDERDIDYDRCERTHSTNDVVQLKTRRMVRPICRSRIDFQLCPQCPHFSNQTECELFRDSCKERRVKETERLTYCDKKYGKWRTMFVPADYSQCRCCDECIFYRELDQSCVHDEFHFETDENLPVTTIDFRAGCNPYVGHPEQELLALRCEHALRRCVPISVPRVPTENFSMHRAYRYTPPPRPAECPASCRGVPCPRGTLPEAQCPRGAFIPESGGCNCCGRCSRHQQLNQKCAEFKKTDIDVNGSKEIEVEEEFLEPGCDDGLVCRQGICQDIHTLETNMTRRARSDDGFEEPYEPCRREMLQFKKKFGKDGHLHMEAPQCSPLWLYAPVQCRRFVCYCALEDGTMIQGIKVPRVEVSNMNCDLARPSIEGKNKKSGLQYSYQQNWWRSSPPPDPVTDFEDNVVALMNKNSVDSHEGVAESIVKLHGSNEMAADAIVQIDVLNEEYAVDCAREKCRTGFTTECDGYGNYKEPVFTVPADPVGGSDDSSPSRTAPPPN